MRLDPAIITALEKEIGAAADRLNAKPSGTAEYDQAAQQLAQLEAQLERYQAQVT